MQVVSLFMFPAGLLPGSRRYIGRNDADIGFIGSGDLEGECDVALNADDILISQWALGNNTSGKPLLAYGETICSWRT